MEVPKQLNNTTTVSGTFNGKSFLLKGKGDGLPYDGQLHSRLETTTGPLHFPMHILDIVAIFGYPTYSKYHADAVDLFKISRGGYEYERNITFNEGGSMSTLQKIVSKDDGLHGDFKVTQGQCPNFPELEGIEPIVETFIPAGPGKIKGRCVVAWRKTGGGLFTANCESEYRLKHDKTIPYLQFRFVEFTTNHTQEVFDQKERHDVIRQLPR